MCTKREMTLKKKCICEWCVPDFHLHSGFFDSSRAYVIFVYKTKAKKNLICDNRSKMHGKCFVINILGNNLPFIQVESETNKSITKNNIYTNTTDCSISLPELYSDNKDEITRTPQPTAVQLKLVLIWFAHKWKTIYIILTRIWSKNYYYSEGIIKGGRKIRLQFFQTELEFVYFSLNKTKKTTADKTVRQKVNIKLLTERHHKHTQHGKKRHLYALSVAPDIVAMSLCYLTFTTEILRLVHVIIIHSFIHTTPVLPVKSNVQWSANLWASSALLPLLLIKPLTITHTHP